MLSRNTRFPDTKPYRKQRFRPVLERLETRAVPSAGTLDKTFGTGGTVVTDFGFGIAPYAAAMQPADDKIVAAGSSGFGIGASDFTLARYKPDGEPDSSFDLDGQLTTDFFGGDDGAFAVAVQTDGKIVAAGMATSPSGVQDFALARYNAK